MPTNVPTLAAARAVAGVAHVVAHGDGTWDAYLASELYLLPAHARGPSGYIIAGQSNGNRRWDLKLQPLVEAVTGRTCLFVRAAVDGAALSSWQPGQANWNAMMTLVAAAAQRSWCVLWWQGESDDNTDPTLATALLNGVVNGFWTYLGLRTMPCILENRTDGLGTNTQINTVIAAVMASNPHALAGPDFSDVTPSTDGLHFATDAELTLAGNRWWTCIQAARAY